jgi:dTDP-4-dehydrorhamnose 3,5-epimerase
MILTELRSRAFVIKLERRRDERGMNLRAPGSTRESLRSTRLAACGGYIAGRAPSEGATCRDRAWRCSRGALFDVAVDLRVGSPTFCLCFGTELDDESGRMLPSALGEVFERRPKAGAFKANPEVETCVNAQKMET